MVLALAMLPIGAHAQDISISVGNNIPVQDFLGHVFPGTPGNPDGSCQVEIRQTHTGNVILPPAHGQLETYNPLITNSHLGRGVVGTDHSGTYSETFKDRSVLATNSTYYARVFDLSKIYYADTAPFFGPPSGVSSINPEFRTNRLLVSTGEADVDSDDDGIPDAMEMEMGLDPSSPDTDGDGFDDFFEAINDTYLRPTEPDRLTIQINAPSEGAVEPYSVSWDSFRLPNMWYHLQFRPLLDGGAAFSNIWSGTATDEYLDVNVQDWAGTNDPPKGFFRVLVPYGLP